MPKVVRSRAGEVTVVDASRVNAIVDRLRQSKTILNDDGKEVEFTDDVKLSFVGDVESAYPILTAALTNLWETGKFLYEVRERQKQNRLWGVFQITVGLQSTTTNNYVRVFEGFADRLKDFGHLGVSKLQVLARLKEPVAFLEANKDIVEKSDVRSVTKMVQAEKADKITKRKKREPLYVVVGKFKIRLAPNGRFLTVQNLTKDLQNKLTEHIKSFLSEEK